MIKVLEALGIVLIIGIPLGTLAGYLTAIWVERRKK